MHFAFWLLGMQASMCPDEQPELALFLQEFHSQITHGVIAVLKISTSHENSLFLFLSNYFYSGLLLPHFLCTLLECWFLLKVSPCLCRWSHSCALPHTLSFFFMCSLYWSGTHYVDQAGRRFTEFILLLHLECQDYRCVVPPYTELLKIFVKIAVRSTCVASPCLLSSRVVLGVAEASHAVWAKPNYYYYYFAFSSVLDF